MFSIKKVRLVTAAIVCCSVVVSSRQVWEQRYMAKRLADDGVIENWDTTNTWDQAQANEEQNPEATESWELDNTGDAYFDLDNSDWVPEEDCGDKWDNEGEEWEGDSLGDSQNQWPIAEPWTEPSSEHVEWTEPEPAEWESSNEEEWDGAENSGSSDEDWEHADCGEDHDDAGVVESAPQELPADVYSQAYVDALKRIGIENIAAGAKGITYSFYTSAGSCKTPEDIQRDISMIKNFEVIRIYDTDCDGLANILKSMGPNQKIFAGIHYPEVVDASVEIIGRAIQEQADGDWSKIDTVSVGNEMVNFGKATPDQLQASINRARELLRGKGYNGPVVTTDTLVAVLNNRDLCHVSDYIAVNSHPYWDGGVPAQQAGPWLQSQLQMLDDVCGRNGKQIFLAETGWPHKGKKFGQHGDPSKDNQLVAIKSIVDTLGPRTILFTTFNDYWKDGGTHDVEKFWGIFEG